MKETVGRKNPMRKKPFTKPGLNDELHLNILHLCIFKSVGGQEHGVVGGYIPNANSGTYIYVI